MNNLENYLQTKAKLLESLNKNQKLTVTLQKQLCPCQCTIQQEVQHQYNEHSWNKTSKTYSSIRSQKRWMLNLRKIQVIHRIPDKNREHRPVLVKLINSDVKYRVMKEKKNLSHECIFKLVDDVTKHNMDLISKLRKNSNIEGSWYYNCAVYGKTDAGKRI